MKTRLCILLAASVALMSLPWLAPHCGALALVGLVPLLCADRLADGCGIRRFTLWVYAAFVGWNAITTWWICEATVGGGIFAILANAFQMALIWAVFRLAKKRLKGCLPYIFLAAMWIAWEKWYFTAAEVSWPWLALGGAFARTTSLVQWYSATGLLGGSVWIWAVNLSVFGMMVALSDGRFTLAWAKAGRILATAGITLLIAGPVILSEVMYGRYTERCEYGSLKVELAQSNFDPYEKFHAYTQHQQNLQVTNLIDSLWNNAPDGYDRPLLVVTPETFTSDVVLNNPNSSPTLAEFKATLGRRPNTNLLLGASTWEYSSKASRPTPYSRKSGDRWVDNHNSAIMTDASGRIDVYHKSKLVVGTELMPWPRIIRPIDDALGGVIGRCSPQEEPSVLTVNDFAPDGCLRREIPVGVAICYESVYGEYCREYVTRGAQALCVITNDGWWGDTPGYRQHFSYSRLRAIETRRDIARCANTGISAFIDQKGDVIRESGWWQPALLEGEVSLTGHESPFVRYGDIAGRACVLLFALLAAAALIPFKKRN
ncbi:MAG: apolipoprotein N-acyltransferase [Bacteroidales bacterium]|nr:apolipoprotein N-acyltransferase [Bacteroidales bacterium]